MSASPRLPGAPPDGMVALPFGKSCWLILWPIEVLKLLARLQPEERRKLVRRSARWLRECRMRPNPLLPRR